MSVDEPKLEPSDLQRRILDNLGSYSGRSALECFALLLGKAQLLEFGLKNLLHRSHDIEQSQMEYWTLGKIAFEMDSRAFRNDYVNLLKNFVRERNYIAHKLLADSAIIRFMSPETSARFEFRQLWQPAYDLERLLILHDWCEKHKAWDIAS